jgi:tyrosine-protein kinase Etk/Wzc
MNNRDNLLGVLSTVYRWRKAIRNICLLTLAGSIAISLFLDNYYRATTIFYPASPELANPELIFGSTGQVTNYFGSDRDLDRLTEMANSNEVVDYMVRRFRLYEHYDIDSAKTEGPHKVRKRFRKLYSAVKNKNDAIELSVEDTDPELAAQMANAAREKIEEIGQRLIKNSQARLLATFDDNIRRKTSDLDVLADSIKRLQSFYNIYNVGAQGEELSTRLADAQSKIIRARAKLEILDNNPLIPPDTIQYIKADLRAYERERQALMGVDPKNETLTVGRFNEGAPLLNVVADLHFQARKQLTYDMERYNQLKAAYNTAIPSIQLLEVAEKPLIKSRPKRSILVITAVLAAFLFSVLAVLIADAYRDVRWTGEDFYFREQEKKDEPT